MIASMAYSDRLIIPALKRLVLTNRPITITDISNESGVCYATVKARIARLERAGIVQRRGGRRWGSYYELKGEL